MAAFGPCGLFFNFLAASNADFPLPTTYFPPDHIPLANSPPVNRFAAIPSPAALAKLPCPSWFRELDKRLFSVPIYAFMEISASFANIFSNFFRPNHLPTLLLLSLPRPMHRQPYRQNPCL